MSDYALTLYDVAVRGVRGVSLALLPGEVAGVVGPAGAGKTTLLQVAAGCVRPVRGDAWVWGQRITEASAHRLIGYVPDHCTFPRAATVREVLSYYARLHTSTTAERTPAGRVREALELAGLGSSATLLVEELGHAERQRLGLAQAVMAGRRVLV
ncbi:MAG TPA: ATP-binding cassette domain-containing protein, partial [Gemmatimonadales bacterium]|nr:ATP-binding cassette domain-containing protein [Gemmatimonadales bacterium]